ncbi:MAG: hypothetical protein BV456_10470 [Thermoplasmata archaeon M8B2D]|nr:MAG: hypothetical protein BV456_10470 [Thermoplasmata archaeon M8B2D]
MKRIVIVGSTVLSERLIYNFEETGFGKVTGMIDDFEPPKSIKYDREIMGKIKDIPELFEKDAFDYIAVAIGYHNRRFRKQVFDYLRKLEIPIITFVHPTSIVEKNASIKKGTIILSQCIIDFRAEVQENVFLSSRCFVSHHVKIKRHTYCSPAVKLAGQSEVGERCFLGINTTVVDSVEVGDNVQTAAGAVIVKNVPSNVLVAGVPGKIIKEFLKNDAGIDDNLKKAKGENNNIE